MPGKNRVKTGIIPGFRKSAITPCETQNGMLGGFEGMRMTKKNRLLHYHRGVIDHTPVKSHPCDHTPVRCDFATLSQMANYSCYYERIDERPKCKKLNHCQNRAAA